MIIQGNEPLGAKPPDRRFQPRFDEYDVEYAAPVRMNFKQAMIDRRKNDDRDYYPD